MGLKKYITIKDNYLETVFNRKTYIFIYSIES